LTSHAGAPAKTEVLTDPGANFKIVRASMAFPASGAEVVREAAWYRLNGVWCIKRLSLSTSEGGKFRDRWEIEYTEFKPNVEVANGMFSIARLTLAEGARITDGRTGKRYAFRTSDDGNLEFQGSKITLSRQNQWRACPLRSHSVESTITPVVPALTQQ
jgi:hypothetical protein